MTYTAKQIEIAKTNYNSMLVLKTVESYEPQYIGWSQAEQRCEYHNNIVTSILNGNKELEREWKMFFLKEIVKSDRLLAESKAKKTANKEASSDILSPIKEAKRLVEFGKWLNTSGNKFRKEHFSKKYTQESVNAFLSI
jgi:glutamyl/glutaminyl-tRNA synthetase